MLLSSEHGPRLVHMDRAVLGTMPSADHVVAREGQRDMTLERQGSR